MNNVIVTAHAMAFADEFLTSVWEQILRQISQVIQGEIPEGLVNREVWDQPKFQVKLKKILESIQD